ncbi:hypothetical protein WDU94_003234, partial [Cyamophila willieti]
SAKELNVQNAILNPENYRIKLQWKTKSRDPIKNLDDYNRDSLRKIFSKYGPINILAISPKRPGSALLEFENAQSARRARLYELGLPGNPLQLTFLNPEIERFESNNLLSSSQISSSLFPSASESSNIFSSSQKPRNMFPSGLFPSANVSNSLFTSQSNKLVTGSKNSNEIDYEEEVLKQMRKAQEKQS